MHDPIWHGLDVTDTERHLETDRARGLDSAVARERLERHGPNEFAAEEQRRLISLLFAQFADFMIIVLILAAVVSGLLGDMRDAVTIFVIVALNAAVGAGQEYRAQKALSALKKMAAADARVLRDGITQTVPASELVAGDVVKLAAGDIVPADMRLSSATELHMDESALTGESLPVIKNATTLSADKMPVGDRSNMAFRQTAVSKGSGAGIVVATGLQTEVGRIAASLATQKDSRTPLQKRLSAFGTRLALTVLGICLIVLVIGIAGGQPPLLMFLTAVSLAVAAIPEALPAVVTVALAIGAHKLSRQHCLVRRLPAVESLGSVTYICADKTGTLTENRMTVASVYAGGTEFTDLTTLSGKTGSHAVSALALCNDIDPADAAAGDPTEIALFEAAETAGADKATLENRLPRISALAFDSERQLMTTLHRDGSAAIAYTKGAPESVFERCTTALDASGNETTFDRDTAEAAADELAGRGYRVLAIAMREFDAVPTAPESDTIERQMTFIGLAGLHDPIRPEVPGAIRECLTAGISPIMITGDHPQTALNIGIKLGLANDGTVVMTGRELDELSDDQLLERMRNTRIFARVEPTQKIRIVETLQKANEFVAMTGDGVNDAPALKQASIGVAMGRRGTDVAREASDLVLLDDNFATIVSAVREGRRIYDNVRKFIKYSMTSNSGEIWVLLLALLTALPLPLLPIHILWVNLVTDGLPGLAFSAEPVEQDAMRRAPRPPGESVFSGGMWQHMLWVGLSIAGLSLATALFADAPELTYWQTMVFTTLVTAQLFQALAIRSERYSILTIGLLSNRYMLTAVLGTLLLQVALIYVPFLNSALRTTPLSVADLLTSLALGALILPLVEIEKMLRRRPSAPENRAQAPQP